MKSSHRAGQELTTLLLAARCDVWYWRYELFATKKNGSKGSFYVANVRKKVIDGMPVSTDVETQRIAEQFYRMMKEGKINVANEEENRNSEDVVVEPATVEVRNEAGEEEIAAEDDVPF